MFRLEHYAGFDRVLLFSPDGRIIQVEYARRAAARGAISVGVCAKDGVVLAGRRRIDTLIKPSPKVFLIDDHVAITFSGFSADGLSLINYARERAQVYRYVYNEPADIKYIVLEIAEQMHVYTQIGGLRPFGVGLLIGGIDTSGPSLYYLDPGGAISELIAGAVGRNRERTETFLREYVKKNGAELTLDTALKIALAGVLIASEKKMDPEEIEIGYIKTGVTFKIVTAADPEMKPYYEEALKLAEEFSKTHKEE